MSKIFLVILYIYTACYMFWFTGRTVEVTYDDNSGSIIQNKPDIVRFQIQETYENGRLIKEVEYDPYIKANGDTSDLESTKIIEYRYALNSTEVEIVTSVTEGDISDTDSIVYQMQEADNHVIALLSWGVDRQAGTVVVRIHSVKEYGEDYEIRTRYKSDGTVEIEDSRK